MEKAVQEINYLISMGKSRNNENNKCFINTLNYISLCKKLKDSYLDDNKTIDRVNGLLLEYRDIIENSIMSLEEKIICSSFYDSVLYMYGWNINKEESKSIGFVYLIQIGNFYKIGKTKDIKSRIMSYNTHNPNDKIEILKYVLLENYGQIELDLHRKYKANRVKNEWFNFNNKELIDISQFLECISLDNK
jgi:hypothetical protein